MLASRKLLLRRLVLDVMAILIEVVGVSSKRPGSPNLGWLFPATALVELATKEAEDNGDQNCNQNERHQKIELQIRRLLGDGVGWGSIVGHTAALLDPRRCPNSRTGGRPIAATPCATGAAFAGSFL